MFGVRTVLLGLDLLQPDGPGRDRAVRVSPFIHAADAASALSAGAAGHLPGKAAKTGATLSGINLALALTLRRR